MFGYTTHRGAYVTPGVYIFGGYTDSNGDWGMPYGLQSIQNYNGSAISTNSLTLVDPVLAQSSNAIGSNIYIFGGYHNAISPTDYTTSDHPSPATNKIQKLDGVRCAYISATMSAARYTFGSAPLGNNVYNFGGRSSPILYPYAGYGINCTERFDGVTNYVVNSTMSWGSGKPVGFGSSILVFEYGSSATIRSYTGGDSYGSVLSTATWTDSTKMPGVLGSNAYLFGGEQSGGNYQTGGVGQFIKKWDGTSLTNLSNTITYNFFNSTISTYKSKVYCIGGEAFRAFSGQPDIVNLNYISSFDGTTFVRESATISTPARNQSSCSLTK
jgi:hypothetical protein